MKLTEKIENIEKEKMKKVSEKDIQKFFESLDYDKADISADRLYVKVKFYANVIKVKDYLFPTEESKRIFEKMGISNLVTKYTKANGDYFSSFEFNVDRNKLVNFWYK